MAILVSLAGLLLISFALFSIASDPGSAKARPKTKRKRTPLLLAHPTPSAGRGRLFRSTAGGRRNSEDEMSDNNGLKTPLLKRTVDDAEREEERRRGLTSLNSEGDSDGLTSSVGFNSTSQHCDGDGDDNSIRNSGVRGLAISSWEDHGEDQQHHRIPPLPLQPLPRRHGSDSCTRSSEHTINIDGDHANFNHHKNEEVEGACLSATPQREGIVSSKGADAMSRSPAVLRWNKLGYYVSGQGEQGGAEMAVLRGVSGFVGPEELPFHPRRRQRQQGSGTVDSVFDDETATTRTFREISSSRSGCGGGREGAIQTETALVSSPSNSSTSTRVPSNMYHSSPAAATQRPGSSGVRSSFNSTNDMPRTSSRTSSTITGILGPSGAGKSSLLDLLAGRKRLGEGRTSGSVSLSFLDSGSSSTLIRGPRHNIAGEVGDEEEGGGRKESAEAVRRESGYVSQEDILPGTLTCYEHLMFHARLRCVHPSVSFDERRARVLWVIRELGLGRVADSRIGDEQARGLSGGERRRLSIAAELVARPALLFLDEPTTGLGKEGGI